MTSPTDGPQRTGTDTDESTLLKANTLVEALPFMRRYAGTTVVIKYGGHAMGNPRLAHDFARDVVLLKQIGTHPVVVHGGGPQIGQMLEKLKIQSTFVDGLRVTDADTVDIVEMVLSGSINKSIVQAIQQVGGRAIGLSGKDGHLITARKVQRRRRDPESSIERVLDLGFVGEPESLDPTIIKSFNNTDVIPVIAPIGAGFSGETFNINADTVAGALAAALRATRLLLLTDVPGVLDKSGTLVPQLSTTTARTMMADGTIHGGMIPKVETCIHAVDHSVGGAVILDGRIPHVILLEIFTDGGVGTLVTHG